MKKFIILIIIFGVAVASYYVIQNQSATEVLKTPVTSENGSFRPDPSNATFTFDDGPVTLLAGHSERAVAPDSTFVEETVLLDKFAYDDLNADGKEDTVVLLARYGGGSGTFIYLAAFVSGPITYRGSNAFFIGDRVVPQSIAINKGIVIVTYLDRGPNEALAAEPTVPTSKQFSYQAGEFQQR